jgi:hypothetical protein
MPDLSRTPPADVRAALRKEVGFGCPVPECRSVFLQYHHFDPEWHIRNHHELKGIIPLCATHHAQAAAFTVEQLREFKRVAHELPAAGRFEWLRHDLVGIVGGGIYHEVPVLVQLRDTPMIWFNRDEAGRALLNVRMLTTEGHERERVAIRDNDFIVRGAPTDFETPPSGRSLRVRYENGDYMRVEFQEIKNIDSAVKNFKEIDLEFLQTLPQQWPLTFVLITMKAGGTEYYFAPGATHLPRNNTFKISVSGGKVGFRINP